jgi:hypothetical protein
MDGINSHGIDSTSAPAGGAMAVRAWGYAPRNALSTGLVAAALFAILALLLTGVLGCSDRTSLIPNSDPALRKTKTEFAKDALARQPYHQDAPKGGKIAGRAQYDYEDETLQIANFTSEDWKDVEVWVNGRYVVFLPKIEGNAKIAKTIDFEMMYDEFGKPFPTKNTTPESMIHKVEVYQGGKMYQVSAAPAD